MDMCLRTMDDQVPSFSFTSAFDEKHENLMLADELPRFSLSPGRSISPIEDFLLDLDALSPHTCHTMDEEELLQPISCNFVAFSEIDAKITPLKGLETIFENVFLETPQRGGGRSVIPRRRYYGDAKDVPDDSSDDGDEESGVVQLRELDEEEDHPSSPTSGGDTYEAIMYEDAETLCSTSIIQGHFGAISTTTTAADTKTMTTTEAASAVASICNSFQRRLNLIPGED